MNRAFGIFAVFGVATALGAQACNGLALENRPCPCASGWVCCADQNICVAEGASCGSTALPDASNPADASVDQDTGVPPADPVCDHDCVPTTLARVPNAFRLACAPGVIYAGTTDGQVLAVPLLAPTPTAIAPAPGGLVGFLSWADGKLFYTLPTQGEVRVRDLTSGADRRLASNQVHPQGIAAAGTDVFFATADNVMRVSPDVAEQTPTVIVPFDAMGPQPRGAAMGLALAGPRLVVAHSPAASADSSGSLATYVSTGEQLSHYTFFSKTIGVAASEAHTYWSESLGAVRFGPKPITPNGLHPANLVSDQIMIGDICIQDGRLYFTAANDDDVREIRYVVIE